MNHTEGNNKVEEALKAYESSDFEQAENLSRHVLQQRFSDTHNCPEFNKALFLAAKSHANRIDDKRILNELVTAESQQTFCILSHRFPANLDIFHGSALNFAEMRKKSDMVFTCTNQMIPAEALAAVLFLCGLCLDYGLFSCALNIALQLHISAWKSQQSTSLFSNPDSKGISNPADVDENLIERDYLALDLPPIGLTQDLWLRITECCRGLSPYIAHMEPNGQNLTHTENESVIKDCQDSVDYFTVDNVEQLLSDATDAPHFKSAHDFSMKEEQLRTHTIGEQTIQSNTVLSTTEVPESTKKISLNLRESCNGPVACAITSQRTNDDYLPGMWTGITAAPFTWRPVGLEDGAVPMAGENTNNAWSSEFIYAPERKDFEVSARLCRRLHGTIDDPFDANPSVNEEFDDEQNGTQDDYPCEEPESSSPPPEQLIRRISILRTPTLNADGEPVRSPPKKVRFSLDSTHPSPALEAEYGGRSNRRRLLDFARRRQLLAHMSDDSLDDSDNPYNFFVQANLCLFGWFIRGIRSFVHVIRFLIQLCLAPFVSWCRLFCFLTGLVFLTFAFMWHTSVEQLWFRPFDDLFTKISTLLKRFWLIVPRWLRDHLTSDAIDTV